MANLNLSSVFSTYVKNPAGGKTVSASFSTFDDKVYTGGEADFTVDSSQKGYSTDLYFGQGKSITDKDTKWTQDSLPATSTAWVIAKGKVDSLGAHQETSSSTTGNITSASVQSAFGNNTLDLTGIYKDADVAITASSEGQESYKISNATFQYEQGAAFDVTSANSVALAADTTIASGTLNVKSIETSTDDYTEITLNSTSAAVSVAAGGLDSIATVFNTNVGKIDVAETDDKTATKVTYNGTITGLDKGGAFGIAKSDDDAVTETTLSVNGKEFTFVRDAEAVMTYGSDGNYSLNAGSERLVRAETYYVSSEEASVEAKYNGGGSGKNKGIVVSTDGTISDINKGEAVTITGSDASSTTVVSANSNGVLMVREGADVPSFYKIDSEGTAAIDATGVTGVDADASIDGASFKWTLKSNAGDGVGSVAASIVDGVYLDSEGNASNEKNSKNVGVFGVTDAAVTFDASASSKGQVIEAGSLTDRQWNIIGSTGDDSINAASNTDGDGISAVSAGAGNDTIIAGGSARFVLDGGAGNDVIWSSAATDLYLVGGAGKDSISVSSVTGGATVDAGADNDVVGFTGVGGDYKVTLGAGDDVASIGGSGTFQIFGVSGNNSINGSLIDGDEATIRGGSGNDTISANENVVVYGGDGKDYFDIGSSDITVSDFKFNDDYVMVSDSVVSAASISIESADGKIGYGGKTADLGSGTGTGSFFGVKLVGSTGKNEQVVGWASEKGGLMDTTGYQDKGLIAISYNNEDVSDTVISGVKDDTIQVGSNDAVYAGAGNDLVSLASGSEKVTVAVFSDMGKDSIVGFGGGFESESNALRMMDGNAQDLSFSYDGSDVSIKLGSGKATLSGITANSETGAAEIMVSGAKVAVANSSGGSINVSDADYADYYFGNSDGLSFANVSDDITVDLRDSVKYRGINQLIGGHGANVLYGTGKADTITAGAGATSVIAGAGKDVINLNDESGHTVGFNTGDGVDTVYGFVATTPDNYDSTADTVYFMNASSYKSGAINNNGDVQLTLTDDSKLILSGVGGDSAIHYTMDGVNYSYAKFQSKGGSFTYTEGVDYYNGAGNNILALDSSAGDANIWLDGSHGASYAGVNAIDASSASGTYELAGTTGNETIIGGNGTNYIWGKQGNDLMVGNGNTTFYYELGDSNDTITSSNSDDSVVLRNMTLDDIRKAELVGSTIEFEFSDQGKLNVDSTVRNFKLALTGQEFYLDENNQWQVKNTQNS